MREILFKAKRIDEQHKGEWIKGTPFFSPDKGRCILIHAVAVHPDFVDDDGRVYYSEGTPVDPQTVCQYTGLTDRNGVKVFEGDILKFTDKFNDYEWTGRMEFGNPNAGYTWGWQLVHLSGEKPNIDTLCWFDMEESGAYSEVIGNIHDKEE